MKMPTSKGESLLRTRIMVQINQNELCSKQAWKHPDGSLFRKLKVMCFISSVFSFLVFTLNELVFFMLYGSGFDMTDEQVVFFSRNQWIVHAAFLLAIIAFLFMCFKKIQLACKINLLVGAFIIFQIFQVFNGLYANKELLGILYLFGLIPLFCSIGMLLLSMGYKQRVNKAVENEIQFLYHKYDKGEDLMSAQEWDAILEQHERDLLNQ